MSSLIEDVDGSLHLDFNSGGGEHGELKNWTVSVYDGQQFITFSGPGLVVSVPIPSAAVLEKLSELFKRAAQLHDVSAFAHELKDL